MPISYPTCWQPSPSRRTSCPPEEDVRRMRIREEGAIVENNYQEHRHSYSGPPSTDNGYYRAPHSTPEVVAHYPRAQSSENFRSPYVRKKILIIKEEIKSKNSWTSSFKLRVKALHGRHHIWGRGEYRNHPINISPGYTIWGYQVYWFHL